jgi:SRSO17 transposase
LVPRRHPGRGAGQCRRTALAIEDGFETAKTELGLDHNETRSWHGWHRHVLPVMPAFAMLAAIRRQTNTPTPPKAACG